MAALVNFAGVFLYCILYFIVLKKSLFFMSAWSLWLSILFFTVNSEIFAMVLFSRNFAAAKFRENKSLAKWRNHCTVY